MAKDLTTSAISRQNILNSPVALPRIQEALEVKALEFEGRYVLTKQMVADYYGVDERTITNCLSANEDELRKNGYVLCKSNSLKDFNLKYAQEIDFPSKTPQIGIFLFSALS